MTMIFGVPLPALAGQLLVGLINGSFYALLSLGLAVIFGLLRVINFAHGAQYMLGAFTAYLLLHHGGIGFWPALVVAPVIVQRIGDVLVQLKAKGMTLLLVEQNFRFARKVADRFFLMEDGHILESFRTGELDTKMDRLRQVVGV